MEERAEARTPHEVPPTQQRKEEGKTNINLPEERQTEGKEIQANENVSFSATRGQPNWPRR